MNQQLISVYIQLELQEVQTKRQIREVEISTQTEGETWTQHALYRQFKERLERISKAKHRMDEGSYGQCLICDMPIDVERLKVLPEATTCVKCT